MFATFKIILCITFITSILETTAENAAPCFQKESKEIRTLNLTKSSETEIKLELPSVIANLTENISKNSSDESEKVIARINPSNSEQKGEQGNNFSTTEFLKPIEENTDKLNISERMLPIITNSSISEKLETNDTEESEKIIESSTINVNLKNSEFVNNITELENNQKTTEIIIDDKQKSSTEMTLQLKKEKRQIYSDNRQDKVKNEDIFLKAFKNCKLLVGERFLRMGDQNPEKIRKCVLDELQKLESFDGEYTKLLDNSKFIRKL